MTINSKNELRQVIKNIEYSLCQMKMNIEDYENIPKEAKDSFLYHSSIIRKLLTAKDIRHCFDK